MSRLCSVEGCSKQVLKRGWCSTHYWRWRRNGDPLAVSRGPARTFYDEVVLVFEGEDCLIWPYAKDKAGYAQMGVDGHKRSVHRILCIAVLGDPPTNAHQAAHTCGRGHEGCVSKKHLAWKTPLENTADQVVHGTRVRGERQYRAKMTEAQVRAVLANKDGCTQRELASRYGVKPSAISKIMRGLNWAYLSENP